MFRILLLIFLLVPIAEIYVLISVGGVIGVGWTVFLVVFTAVLGAALVRRQGFATLQRVQASLDRGELPATELLEGLVLLAAGALLLTPGFITDAIGFACLTPPLRRALIRWALAKGVVQSVHGRTRPNRPVDRPLEGEYRHIDE